ncbi:uncharacterized protein LOC129892087 [Solanum dulcamara]|uniref:uncharacterized protein LOC129892087 n=1 Tax=Solanum dulcamara TaxID=45834 RepID=UPI002485A38C|nr:uncharacterized protein LOC129892087 [Solanum dulcamara]
MEDLSTSVDIQWMIGGDFNAITLEDEKFGGLSVTINEIQDFRGCIKNCGISDLGFSGSKFTWWNGLNGDDCIFKRLDRCLGNQLLQAKYFSMGFIEVIRQNWTTNFLANPFILFHHKLKKMKAALAQWSKAIFGNIFQEIEVLEEIIKDGDRNTKFFHAHVQGRRKRMQIRRIQGEDKNWIKEEGKIIAEAIRFYTAQLIKEEDPKDFEILNHLP